MSLLPSHIHFFSFPFCVDKRGAKATGRNLFGPSLSAPGTTCNSAPQPLRRGACSASLPLCEMKATPAQFQRRECLELLGLSSKCYLTLISQPNKKTNDVILNSGTKCSVIQDLYLHTKPRETTPVILSVAKDLEVFFTELM